MASVINLTILGFPLATTLFAHPVKDYLASGLACEKLSGKIWGKKTHPQSAQHHSLGFVLDCIARRIIAQNKNFDYEYNVASILKTLQLGLHHEELYLELWVKMHLSLSCFGQSIAPEKNNIKQTN